MTGLNITQLVMLIIVIISFSLIIYFVVKSLKQKCDVDYTYDKKLKRCQPVCKDDLPFYDSQKNICLECPQNISENKVACELFSKLSGQWKSKDKDFDDNLTFERDINDNFFFVKTQLAKQNIKFDFNDWINNNQFIEMNTKLLGVVQYKFKSYTSSKLTLIVSLPTQGVPDQEIVYSKV